jgi:hypothetical protein
MRKNGSRLLFAVQFRGFYGKKKRIAISGVSEQFRSPSAGGGGWRPTLLAS